MTSHHNRIHIPMASPDWQTDSWQLLTCDSDWGDYKAALDRQRFGDPDPQRSHNHGSFHPDSYPCLVWSFNTFAAILQHRFLYPEDVQPLWDELAEEPVPQRERLSGLAEERA